MFVLRLPLLHELRFKRGGLRNLPAPFWSTIKHVAEEVAENHAIH